MNGKVVRPKRVVVAGACFFIGIKSRRPFLSLRNLFEIMCTLLLLLLVLPLHLLFALFLVILCHKNIFNEFHTTLNLHSYSEFAMVFFLIVLFFMKMSITFRVRRQIWVFFSIRYRVAQIN